MKWFSLAFVILLLVGMLLGSSSVAYAGPGDGEEGNTDLLLEDSDDGNPDDSFQVGIIITGDDADVGVDIYGDDADVWINGQNLNEPTAVYNVSNTYGGASSMGVRRLVKDVMFPYMDEIWARLNLTANGLAKVITVVTGHHESTLADHGANIYNTSVQVSSNAIRLGNVEDGLSQASSRLSALEAQDEATIAYIQAYGDFQRAYYNRVLITVVILFSVVIIGLAISTGLLWRRLRRT